MRPKRPPIELISVSYTEQFLRLIQSQLIARAPLIPLLHLYPRWYDVNASCDYHYGGKGHSTKNCLALRPKVQDLMKAGYVSFDYNASRGSNITNNPLPNHPRPNINALTKDSTRFMETRVNDVKTPMENVYKALVQAKVFHPKKIETIKGKKTKTGH